MSDSERIRVASLGAIVTLAGLLIVIINQHALFPDVVFYSLVSVFTIVIVFIVVYTFLWGCITRHFRERHLKKERDRLARVCLGDFRDFVEQFTSLGEFNNVGQGITGILSDMVASAPKEQGILIRERIQNAGSILQKPLKDFKQKLNELCFNKKDINYQFLSSLAREFENYIQLHKLLYVDFAIIKAREIGLDQIKQQTKTAYADYKDDYNQFIIAYTDFAKEKRKARIGIFNQNLTKANEL